MSYADLAKLVFSYNERRIREAQKIDTLFAHYTTADTALQIIRNKSVWLRNASVMNDFSEIEHGIQCLEYALAGSNGSLFRSIVNSAHRGLYDEIIHHKNTSLKNLREATYLMCLAGHPPDDLSGRLSMWRAYGGQVAGVALLFNPDPFLEPSVTGAFMSPVLYAYAVDFEEEFTNYVRTFEDRTALLRLTSRGEVRELISSALLFSIMSTKHPAFIEEEEWRIIYNPTMHKSDFFQKRVEVIRGVPQIIYAAPLERASNSDLPDFSIPRLIDRVLIGPCLYPDQVKLAFVEALSASGIDDPADRVEVTGIPLRHWG